MRAGSLCFVYCVVRHITQEVRREGGCIMGTVKERSLIRLVDMTGILRYRGPLRIRSS